MSKENVDKGFVSIILAHVPAALRKDKSSILLATVFFLTAAVSLFGFLPGSTAVQYASVSEKRPILYTYFSLDPSRQDREGYNGMQDEMLDFWSAKWHAAGWEPRILSEEDARKHPKFDLYDAQISKLDLSPYKRLCFYRWMAMSAATDGGWLTEYDVYPLHVDKLAKKNLFVLPYNGRLTMYENNMNHGPVPSLVSGSSAEWNRVTAALMEYVPQHEGEDFNDIKALAQYIMDNPKGIEVVDGVTNAVVLEADLSKGGQIDCSWYKDKIGIHFSFRAVGDGLEHNNIRKDKRAQSRAFFAREFLANFRSQCEGK